MKLSFIIFTMLVFVLALPLAFADIVNLARSNTLNVTDTYIDACDLNTIPIFCMQTELICLS